MISISTTSADILGNVVINNCSASNLLNKTARLSRVKTLDGGAYINHSGFVHGDRTLLINEKINVTQAAILKNLFENYTQILISMNEGLFLGAIPSINTENGNLKMTIYIKNKEV